jgi:ketosteroid isomerase-like protein
MKKAKVISVSLLFVMLLMSNVTMGQYNSQYATMIRELNGKMANAMLRGNSEFSLSLYTDDAISMPSYSPLADGIAAIRSASAAMAEQGMKYNSFDMTTLKLIPAGDLVLEVGTYKLSFTKQGEEKSMDDHGKYLTVWEKQKDGTLKIKIETWNSDVNPMSMEKTMGENVKEK